MRERAPRCNTASTKCRNRGHTNRLGSYMPQKQPEEVTPGTVWICLVPLGCPSSETYDGATYCPSAVRTISLE